MKLTKNQQEFIGTTFYVERTGATLTVTGVVGKTKSGNALFSVDCSECSKDHILFPDPVFSITKNHLQNKEGCLNRIPCGCSLRYIWDYRQDEILTQRILDDKMPYLSIIGSEKVKGKSRRFTLECAVCSRDTLLWSEGSITTLKGSIVDGQIPCGCSESPKWKEYQYKIKIERECEDRGYVFHGWGLLGFSGENSYLDLENLTTGHRWQSTAIKHFLRGAGDPEVARDSGICYGYYPHRTTEQDNLYVIRFKKDKVIKVGRAFEVTSRLNGSKGLLKISDHQLQDIEILKTLTGTHQEVYDTEQWVHEELTERGFHASWIPWTTECFTEDSEDMIYRLLDESGLVEGEW